MEAHDSGTSLSSDVHATYVAPRSGQKSTAIGKSVTTTQSTGRILLSEEITGRNHKVGMSTISRWTLEGAEISFKQSLYRDVRRTPIETQLAVHSGRRLQTPAILLEIHICDRWSGRRFFFLLLSDAYLVAKSVVLPTPSSGHLQWSVLHQLDGPTNGYARYNRP